MKIIYLRDRSFLQRIKSWFARILIQLGWGQGSIRLLLKQTRLFDHLEDQKLCSLGKSLRPLYYAKGDLIFQQGEIGDRFYLIQTGSVAIFSGQEIVLARLEKGDYFGEQALMSESPGRRMASARALKSTTVYTIPHLIYLKIIDPEAKKILQKIGDLELFELLNENLEIHTPIEQNFLEHAPGKILKYSDGEVIFKVHDKPDRVYFIVSGKVLIDIFSGEEKVQTTELGVGELFGELGALTRTERVGTAVAVGELVVFSIDVPIFKQLHDTFPELQQLVQALQTIYRLQHRGRVTLQYGTLFKMKAMIATYHLDHGGTVSSVKVIGKPIFTLSYEGVQTGNLLQYTKGVQHRRTLLLVERKIRKIMSLGDWPELSTICNLALNQQSITDEQILRFKKEGQLTDPEQKEMLPLEKAEILCSCMNVSKGQIYDLISRGTNQLEEICHRTGAGSVCGCCRPQITELLGLRSWTTVQLMQKIPLAPNICAFRFHALEKHQIRYLPGQFIIIQALIKGRLISRSYTLTSLQERDDFFEIIVKKEGKGSFSPWLFELAGETSLIRISEPQGKFIFEPTLDRPLLFFAAGIGITPALVFARSIAHKNLDQPLYVDYSSRHDFILKEEWQEITKNHKNIIVHYRATEGEGHRLEAKEIIEMIKNRSDLSNCDYCICGPQSFEDLVVSALKNQGVALDRIRTERFVYAGGPPKGEIGEAQVD